MTPKFKVKFNSFKLNLFIEIILGFFIRAFIGPQEKGGNQLYFSLSPARKHYSDILFATLDVRWVPQIFNRSACNSQTVTRWDMPPWGVTIWLIDDDMLISVCLVHDVILGLYLSNLTLENGGVELAWTITLALHCFSHDVMVFKCEGAIVIKVILNSVFPCFWYNID